MDRAFASGSSATPPTAPVSPSIGYATEGNPGTGTPPTEPGPWWFHMVTEELMNLVTSAGLTPAQGTLTQLKQALDALYAAKAVSYMHIRDEKAAGTNGGASIAGINTRVMNTVVSNTISGASLASNQITLPAGTYRIGASVPACSSQMHRAYLYNVTDAAVAALGTAENTDNLSADGQTSRSFIVGRLVLAAAKVFELRHYTSGAVAAFGLGSPVNSGGLAEVYSIVEITKEA